MSSEAVSLVEAEGRSDQRTNMFIAAAMYAKGVSSPVKVRNMSPSGALIEAAVSPAIGTDVRLCRGSLLVSGKVAWSAGNRCGVRFTSSVTVRDWMAPPANAGQAQVDAKVAQVRAGTMASVTPTSPSEPKSHSAALARVSALLEELGEALADDVTTVSQHGPELQKIDRALQLLAAIRAER